MKDILRVGVSPWAHMDPKCFPNSETGCEEGPELELLGLLATMANLTIKFVYTNVVGCGQIPASGPWTGLYQLLQNGTIDVAGNMCTANKLARVKQDVFDASWPVWQYQDQYVIQAPKPPPVSFSPGISFSTPVWLVYGLIGCFYVFCVSCAYVITQHRPHHTLRESVLEGLHFLCGPCLHFYQHFPLGFLWPPWLLMITTGLIFYATFILSAVLHPFPIWQPFSGGDQLVDVLSECRYKMMSYKVGPSTLTGCWSEACIARLAQADKQCDHVELVGASGYRLLSTIVDQKSDEPSKLVLAQGAPFISLYLSEYRKGSENLWIMNDDTSMTWSSYFWRKNFTYASQFNYYLKMLGDYKSYTLVRKGRLPGAQPHTGPSISDRTPQVGLSLQNLQMLFVFLFGSQAAAVFVLAIEKLSKRNVTEVVAIHIVNKR